MKCCKIKIIDVKISKFGTTHKLVEVVLNTLDIVQYSFDGLTFYDKVLQLPPFDATQLKKITVRIKSKKDCIDSIFFISANKIQIQGTCPIPIISTQSQSQNIQIGASLTLFVTASVTNGVLSYKWYQDGVLIVGANATSYQINNVSANNAGHYVCQISNICNVETQSIINSNTISITVETSPTACPTPIITQQPENTSQNIGGTVTLGVIATNYTSVAWYKVGSNSIVGTGNALTFTNAQGAVSGSYYCILTNACGGGLTTSTLQSATATISIINPILTSKIIFPTFEDGVVTLDGNGNVTDTLMKIVFNSDYNITDTRYTDLLGDPNGYKKWKINQGDWQSGPLTNVTFNPTAWAGKEAQITVAKYTTPNSGVPQFMWNEIIQFKS